MQVFEGIGIALSSLRSNKVRASLTVLGVGIGVAVVMAIASVITGLNAGVSDLVQQLGPRTFFVFRYFQGGIQISDGAAADGVELRVVTDAAGARDFADVSTRAYETMGLPAKVANHIFCAPERILQPHIVSVVAYRNGAPSPAAIMRWYIASK